MSSMTRRPKSNISFSQGKKRTVSKVYIHFNTNDKSLEVSARLLKLEIVQTI